MKTTRYRIRIIALLLIVSFLAMIMWIVHDIWFPSGFFSEASSPGADLSPSAETQDPDPETPFPQPEHTEPETPSPEIPTPEPLFDTFGL